MRVEQGEVVPGQGIVGTEAQSLRESLASFGMALQVVEGQTQVEPGRGVSSVDAQSGFEIAEGALILAALQVVGTEVVIDFVVVGEDRQGLVEGLADLLVFAAFEMGLAEGVSGAGTLWVGCDRAGKERVVVLPVVAADGGVQR